MYQIQATKAALQATALAAAVTLLVTGCDQTNPAAAAPAARPPTVSIATVASRKISPVAELQGRVEAIEEVEVRARVSGHVVAINYRDGGEVPAGATLFSIDPRPYRALLDRATAELARAVSRSAQAKREFTRAEQLLAAGALSGVDRDNAESAVSQTDAELQAARATLASAQLDMQFTQVRAAVAGRVGRAVVSIGDFVTAAPAPTLLTTLVSIDPVYVYFTADEPTFLRFAAHSEHAEVDVGLADEADYPHRGRIDFVDNHLDAATGTIRLRARLANPDRRFTPGLFARVRLQEGSVRSAITIDSKAVLTDQDRKYVLVLGAADKVERRDVKLGPIVDGLSVVDQGLSDGDRLIVNGTQKVLPGVKATAAPVADAKLEEAKHERNP